MNLIYVDRELTDTEKKSINNLPESENIIVSSTNLHSSKSLKPGFKFFELPSLEIENISKQAFEKILDLGHLKNGSNSLIEHYSFQNNTFWYYIRMPLFYAYKA